MRRPAYENILKLLKRYLAQIAETFKSIDLPKYDKTMSTIAEFESSLPKIKDSIKTSTECVEQYYLYGELDATLQSLVNSTVEMKYFDKYVYKYSQTFVSEITSLRVSIIDAMTVYINESKKYDDLLFPTIKLDGAPDITDKPNKFIVYALAKWVPTLGDGAKAVLEKVEATKDSILKTAPRKMTDYHPYRYGLKPYGTFITEDKLPPQTIILPAQHGALLAFDIVPLVSEKYIVENNLAMNQLHGLHKNVIKRFSTIMQQSAPQGELKPKLCDKPKYIAVTWDGKLYRLLSDNITMEPSADTIAAITRALTIGPSMRPAAYNGKQTAGIQYTNIKIKSFANEYVGAKFTIDPDAITRPFLESANQYAAEQLKAHKEDYEKLMPEIAAAFVDLLLKSIQRVIKPANSSEVFITMIAKYEALTREFKKIYVKRVKAADKWDNQLYEIQAALNYTVGEINKAKMWADLEVSFKEYVINKSYIII